MTGLDVVNGRLFHTAIGDGPPVVLLHAGIADSRMWQPQIDAFSHHFQVLRYDLRGFGQSTAPAGPFSHHHDLQEMLVALDIERAHIVGLSMGASVALDFALAFPEMVDRLVVSSALGPPPRSQSLLDGWGAVEVAYDQGGLPAANEAEVRIWVDGPHRTPEQVDPDIRRLVAAMNLQALQREETAEHDATVLDPPAFDRLPDIQARTLVLTGDIDQTDVLDYAARLAREIPNARLEVISGAAHMVNMEQTDRFNTLVVNFLTE
jgi:3-oxoadipate enol-lactonase